MAEQNASALLAKHLKDDREESEHKTNLAAAEKPPEPMETSSTSDAKPTEEGDNLCSNQSSSNCEAGETK